MSMIEKIKSILLPALLFLLPWQTRYIWHLGALNNGNWEYGTYSVYATELLLWFTSIVFAIDYFWIKKQRLPSLRVRLKIALLIFFGLIVLSTVLSSNQFVSYYFLMRLWEGLMLYGIIRASNISFLSAAGAMLVGGVVQGAMAIYQFLLQQISAHSWLGVASQQALNGGASVIEFADQRWLRAYGSFGSPNSLGIYLAVVFVLGIVLYIKTKIPQHKIIISVGQLFVLSGLLLSFSRGAWTAAVAGLVSLAAILFFKQKESVRDFIKQMLFTLGAIVFWVLIFYPVFSARFNIHNRLEARSISERVGQYHDAKLFVFAHPWLGVGPGAYTYAMYQKYNKLESWQYQPVHNIYMLMAAEFGLVVALLSILWLLSIARDIYQLNIMYLPVLISLLCAGLFDHWLVSMFSGMLLWWAGLGISNIAQDIAKKS
jgi:hypothetical protein